MMNRRAKRDVIVIDDEEAKREQPPEKIVKEEAESVPSPDVAQLQQQLLKADEKFKRVCEMAGEYKARVEFLENIIDTKEGIIGNANGEESREELKNKVAELTKQLEEQQKNHDSDVERAEELRVSKDREMKLITEENQQLTRENTELKNRIARLKDDMYSSQLKLNLEKDSLQKKLDDALKLNKEFVENGANIHRNELPIVEDFVGKAPFEDGVNAMEDQIMDDHNEAPIEDSFGKVSSNGDVSEDEISGGESDSMDDDVEKEKTDHSTPDTSNDSEDTESLDESTLIVKKTGAKSKKKIDNKRRSDVDEASSKKLECPKCEYRTHSVPGWQNHLHNTHRKSPRQLGVALLCECGNESFSAGHSLSCEISKITIVRKSATPKCVMCEAYPRTACGYALHLTRYHNTSLKQMGIFLVCSCGHKVTSHASYSEHNKKCNGHEFALHKLDDE